MRWLHSPWFIIGVSTLAGLAVASSDYWGAIGAILPAAFAMIRTAAFVAFVLAILLGSVVASIRLLHRVLVGLSCIQCGGRRLQRLRTGPFGRRRYLCRTCGALLWHAPFGVELSLAPPDASVPRPAEVLRYPPTSPLYVPSPLDTAEPSPPLEGPPASLARLVAARRSRHHPPRSPQ